ncbi:hypothetical protein CDAR_36431 [Caerostris darwini]|uniref:Uncharacterized protein n=1 Tax=Caerostris darwini TaxID=1538125 RepID=A0AAV4RT31_9ARAC|nr:hypothetical protein CDAR_36431 [Caerostris darwini]
MRQSQGGFYALPAPLVWARVRIPILATEFSTQIRALKEQCNQVVSTFGSRNENVPFESLKRENLSFFIRMREILAHRSSSERFESISGEVGKASSECTSEWT